MFLYSLYVSKVFLLWIKLQKLPCVCVLRIIYLSWIVPKGASFILTCFVELLKRMKMLLPAGGSFVLFNISGAVCESWPRSDRPEASTLVLEKCKIDNPSVSNAAWTTCWDVEGWTLGAGNFTFLSVMTHRLLLLSFRFHTEKWWMGWSSPPPLAPAVILVRGTVKPASLCVSCCIPVEQVSRNFLQNILFFFWNALCCWGSFLACLLCADAHLAC